MESLPIQSCTLSELVKCLFFQWRNGNKMQEQRVSENLTEIEVPLALFSAV